MMIRFAVVLLLASPSLVADSNVSSLDPIKYVRPSFRQLDTKAAERICVYDDDQNEYVCDQEELEHFDVDISEQLAVETTASVEVVPLSTEQLGCVVALQVRIVHPTSQIAIDWSQVVFVVDGEAVQALPGFARRMTGNLIQRPSVAPPGATLSESVFSIRDSSCLNHSPGLSKMVPSDELQLLFPFTVSESPERFRYTRTRRWMSITEKQAFALVREPRISREPTKPRAVIPDKPSVTPVAAITGGVVGAALGVATGVGVGAYTTPACGVCTGLILTPASIGAGVLGGLAIDTALSEDEKTKHRQDAIGVASLNRAWDEFEASASKHAAWERKRKVVGEQAGPPAAQ